MSTNNLTQTNGQVQTTIQTQNHQSPKAVHIVTQKPKAGQHMLYSEYLQNGSVASDCNHWRFLTFFS